MYFHVLYLWSTHDSETHIRDLTKVSIPTLVNLFIIFRQAENQIWVFGIVDTSYTPSRGYVEIVERRNAATLFPIIQSVCLDGSIIHSDEWKAYQKIPSELGFAATETFSTGTSRSSCTEKDSMKETFSWILLCIFHFFIVFRAFLLFWVK